MSKKETEELTEHISNSLTLLSDYFNQEQLSPTSIIAILQTLFMHGMRCCFVPKDIVKETLTEMANDYEPLITSDKKEELVRMLLEFLNKKKDEPNE